MDSGLDELFNKIGAFGRYQVYVVFVLCLSVILHPIVLASFIFSSMVVKHRCEIPECESHPPKYSEDWVKFAIPYNQNDEPEKCKRYKYVQGESCGKDTFDTRKTETCSKLVYSGKEYTLMQEFDLHCENGAFLLSLVGLTVVCGQIPGVFLAGIIGDKVGRRKTLIFGSVLSGCTGMTKFFLPNFTLFLVVQFFDALVGSGCFMSAFILASEIVGPKWRSFVGNLMSAMYAVGGLYMCLVWIIFRHWKYFLLTLHAPQFLHILLLWIIPDSIRWSLVRGRTEAAKKTIRKLAKVNKKDVTEDELEALGKKTGNSENLSWGANMKLALKSKTLWVRFLICTFCFFTCTLTYYGLTIGSITLSGKYYLDFSLTIIVEIPAYFLCEVFINIFGRNKVFSINFIITSIACITFIFLPKYQWAKLACWLIGKFAITLAFSLIYVYVNEMFHTPVRSTYLGACATLSAFGTASAILVPPMREIWENLPLILFAVFTGVSGIISIFLPETKGKKLPDTIKEAENLKNAPVLI